MTEPFYHFITFQHGYYGGARDLSYFVKLFRDRSCLPKNFIILTPKVNQWFHTEQGVLLCGERLADYIIKQVEDTLGYSEGDGKNADEGSAKDSPDRSACSSFEGKASMTCMTTHLYFSFVAHSMGGLIVRAALPLLATALREKYNCKFASRDAETRSSKDDSICHETRIMVHWETFCSIAVPHVGVAQMPLRLKAWFAKLFASLSTSLRDMCLISNALTETLLEDSYLDVWKCFKRRIVATALNDQTVMTYSSIFSISSKDQEFLRASARTKMKREDVKPNSEIKPDEVSSATSPDLLATEQEKTETGTISHSKLSELTPQLWPMDILPRERAMAERIVQHVGPFEVCLLDLALQLPKDFSIGRLWAHLGVHRFGHGAVICRYPWSNSKVFGILCEYIVNDVLAEVVVETQTSVDSHSAE